MKQNKEATYIKLIFNKSTKVIQWRKNMFSKKRALEQLEIHMVGKRNNFCPLTLQHTHTHKLAMHHRPTFKCTKRKRKVN